MTITFLIIEIERLGLYQFKALDLLFPGIIILFQENVSNSRSHMDPAQELGKWGYSCQNKIRKKEK